ncbi:hypothetical protein ACFZDG_01330 [Kitasatospora xanthocidica]|uniref:hypothetical protein n=1 Tax=Kitasatospora xanthocidica TaxID=83382 RepID=UPI0036E282AF
MPLKRTSALLAAAIVAGLGLTACTDDSPSATASSSASTAAVTAPAAAPSAPSAPATAPSASRSTAAPATTSTVPAAGGAAPTTVIQAGKTRPADLPADIPLPPGKITMVNGMTGAYFITCEAAAGDRATYESALKAAGFEVSPTGDGSSLAEKGESNLLISGSSTTITVAYAKI